MMERWCGLNKRSVGLLLVILGAIPPVQAQLYDLNAYKSKYSGHHVVRLSREKTIKIDLVKSEIQALTTISEDFFILNNEGASILAEDEIFYTSFENLENIDAYAFDGTKKSGKKLKATNFKTKDAENDGSIFHDDNKVTSFLYTGLKEGMVRHLGYELDHHEYRFPHSFHFFSYFPTEKAVFTIDHDTSIHLLKYDYNFDGMDIQFEERVEKDRRIWTWTCTNYAEYRRDSYAPDVYYYLPGTAVQISHYFLNGKRQHVLGDVQDLVNWYSENVDEVLAETPSDELKELAVSLTKDIPIELDKVKAIYYWVQDNIKYIAFEDGMGGLVPRRANEVCEKRFGDCKDMATIIYKMMEAAGIDGRIAWIGTIDIPFKYSEFPSTMVDNHMIAVYYDGDAPIFLDATASNQPIDLPAVGIQGKEALVYKSKDNYKIERVPIADQKQTEIIDKVSITIDGRKVKGTVNSTLTGYYTWIVRNGLLRRNERSADEKVEDYYDYGNNSFKVTKAKISNLEDRELPLIFDFDFEVENYALTIDGEMYVNMVMSKDIHKEDELKSTRTSPFMMDFHSFDIYEVRLQIPEGMKVKFIPENLEYKSDYVYFMINYTADEKEVVLTINNSFSFLILEPKDFIIWNEYVATVKKALSSSVVLIKQ